ncbi:Hypothetical predicted protein, partial [Podarcis lilfordi]
EGRLAPPFKRENLLHPLYRSPGTNSHVKKSGDAAIFKIDTFSSYPGQRVHDPFLKVESKGNMEHSQLLH